MKKAHIILIFLLVVPLITAAAQQGVFDTVDGKVQIRVAGGSWEPAAVGDRVPANATVSTGFGARAVIVLGNSLLEVEPLTRLTLEELVERQGTVSTKMHLDVGRVRADVRSAEGLSNDFQLRSTQSTASVRGTAFEFDGRVLEVEEGIVAFANLLEQRRRVREGQGSKTDGTDYPEFPEWWVKSVTEVSPYTEGAEGEESGPRGAEGTRYGSVEVRF